MTAPRAISPQHQRDVWALVARRLISSLEAFLILVLLSFASRGRIFPSVESIARRAGCSERLVQKLLKHLLKLGVLTLVGKAAQHRPTEYEFTPVALIARGAHGAPLKPAPGGTSATALSGAQRAPDVKIKPKPVKLVRRQADSESPGFCLDDGTSEADLVSAVAASKRVVGNERPALDEADNLSTADSEPSHHTNRGRRAAGLKPRSRTPAVALASAVARPIEGKRSRRRSATIADIAGFR